MTSQPDRKDQHNLAHENLLLIEDHTFDNNGSKRYIKGNFLGKGGFARCYELISEETKDVEAVKIIQKSSLTKPKSKLKLMSEIKIHQSLNHGNIVHFKHNFEDHLNVYIVLELCTNKVIIYLFRLSTIYSNEKKDLHRPKSNTICFRCSMPSNTSIPKISFTGI